MVRIRIDSVCNESNGLGFVVVRFSWLPFLHKSLTRCITLSAKILIDFRRVLSRSESKRFFGRNLEGSAPPQPVLTMIDHLILHGVDVEGIFRKSPKQSTVRMLKAQLDRGSVPDFSQFSAHVTAALLKVSLFVEPKFRSDFMNT